MKKKNPVEENLFQISSNSDLTSSCEDCLHFRNLRNGIIRFYGEISPEYVYKILQEIDEIRRSGLSEIVFYITSPGGYIYDAFALYDALRDLSKFGIKVIAIVEGWAASAAAMIVLQAADERLSRPNSRFLLHEIKRWAFAEEKASDLEDEVKEINALTDMIVEILSKRCSCKRKEIKQLIERKETWMSAKEALDWGLVDKIIDGPNVK